MTEREELGALLTGVAEPHREVLARYGARVLEANRAFNLTGAKTAADFAPHLLDSVALAPYVAGALIDIGSGGGLPAIPLAIVTGLTVTMVEATAKKARFLEELLVEFALAGRVVAERAELAAHDGELRERFWSGTARAVSSAPTVAELLLPFLEIGGRAILQRGEVSPRELQALEDAALMLGGRIEAMEEGAAIGRIIVVRKIAVTPARFPRRNGIPEKRPLCLDPRT